MNKWTRRAFIASVGASAAACTTSAGSSAARIDARVRAALQLMYAELPGSRDLADKANGMLVMPNVTKAGIGIGAAYGEGSLMIHGATVDYYSTAQASIGFQFGAQQYAHTLFFMTPEALADFRGSQGFALGADIQYVVVNTGDSFGVETTSVLSPIVAVVYGQSGLIAGATLEGTKYSRISR